MLTNWLDMALEEPARQIGMSPERLAVQAGGGALAAATNIVFEEFTTTVLNTVGKALIGLGLVASTSEVLPLPRIAYLDDRTKQELLIIGSVIGLDGIYRAIRNLSATQSAINQFLSTLQSGNIIGALQMLVKNPFGSSGISSAYLSSPPLATYSYPYSSPMGTVNIISPAGEAAATGYENSYYGGGGEEELRVPTL